MKKINYIYIAFFFFFFSCSGLLDKSNLGSIGSDKVWTDPLLIESYINNLYSTHYSWERVETDMTDEARNGYGFNAKKMIEGELNSEWNPLGWWQYHYIRKCNDILENLEKATINEDLKMRFEGEVRYFRASAYFHKVIRYGGVPLITDAQDYNSPDLYPSRATIDEVFEFITTEYNLASTLLNNYKTYPDNNFGRVTWGACKAMEARAYLFWASPLYNTKKDHSLWEKSAKASKEVIESGIYQLLDDARNIFLDYKSSENIFAIYYKRPERQHGIDAWCKPVSIANGDAAHWCPVQELVDAFPTIKGLHINDDPDYDENNPYDNRDPRLHKFIVVNDTEYCGRKQYNYASVNKVDPSFPKKEADRFLPEVSGGEHLDVAGSPNNSSTGYLCRKVVQEDLDKSLYGYGKGSETPYIDIRLGEVYLNYAEALNEIGDITTACEQIRILRERAGLETPQVPAIYSKDKETLREFIRNERYIELCFENKRYWDLRRWKIAKEKLDNKKFTGVRIALNLLENSKIIESETYKKASFNDQLDMLNKTWEYSYDVVDDNPYVFESKMYFMPIPKGEIETNSKLNQNEGW